MRSESFGTVRLASKNPSDPPLIDPRFFAEPNDLEKLIDGMEIISHRFINSTIFKEIGIEWANGVRNLESCTDLPFPSR